eukprot:5369926-Prymnesium_polylepis.1
MASRPQHALGQDPAFAGTFNDFGKTNTGFCRLQQPNARNRSTTLGPALLSSARVFSGVGLSQAQFGAGGLLSGSDGEGSGDGSVACGMCLEVSARQALWDCELTQPKDRGDYSKYPMQKVIVMVMDQVRERTRGAWARARRRLISS